MKFTEYLSRNAVFCLDLRERTAHFPSVNFVSFSQNADFPHNRNFSTPFSLSLYSWHSRTRCTVFLSSSLSMRSWRRSRPWWGTKASASWWRPWTQSSSGSSRSSSKDSESHLQSFTTLNIFAQCYPLPPFWKCSEMAKSLPDCGLLIQTFPYSTHAMPYLYSDLALSTIFS